jgi:hypothetical protein
MHDSGKVYQILSVLRDDNLVWTCAVLSRVMASVDGSPGLPLDVEDGEENKQNTEQCHREGRPHTSTWHKKMTPVHAVKDGGI